MSHAALPEAGASKNLTLQAKKLGYYSLAGLLVASRHSLDDENEVDDA